MRYLVLNFAIDTMRLRYFRRRTRNHIALLFHRSYAKSHRVAISPKLLENYIALLFQRSYSKITSSCYFTEVTRNHIALLFQLMIPVNLKITYFGPCHLFLHRYTLLGITHPSTRNYILFLNKNISLIRE